MHKDEKGVIRNKMSISSTTFECTPLCSTVNLNLGLCDFDWKKSRERWWHRGQREGYKMIYRPLQHFYNASLPCTTNPQSHKYTHHLSWISGCNIRRPSSSIFSSHSHASCCQSHSWSISAHSSLDLTGPHIASFSVSVTGSGFTLRGISLHEPNPLMLMKNISCQHNTTKAQVNAEHRLISLVCQSHNTPQSHGKKCCWWC